MKPTVHTLEKKFRNRRLRKNLPDCVAWLLSAWDIQYPDQDFDDGFNNYYSRECPVCHGSVCSCADHYARNKALHSEEDLRRMLESLKELSAQISIEPSVTPSVSEALELINRTTEELKESAATQITSDLRQTVSRNDTLLTRAKSLLMNTPELAGKFNSLFEAYERLKDSLPWI